MNEEQKSIQLEQRIIHLKSELEKYKTMLASFQYDQQSNHLKEQIEQLTTENAQLKEKCSHYEETISTRNYEIDRLSTELEETKKENRLLYDEIEVLKRENFVLQKKVEANEEKIKSLLSDLSNYKQSQAELEKEKEIMEEKNRVLMNEYLSFKSELESLTSWVERIKTMEKDYNFLKENSDKVLRDFEDLKEVLFTRKKETEDLKEEVRILTKKFHAIEEMVSELEREKQKDMAFLQKHILHQHVEIETILEKTSHFAKEIEKISKQLSELTERMEQKSEDSSNSEMNEMKGMLSQLVQLLTPQQNTFYMEETTPPPKQPIIKNNTGNTPPHTNSFLKLNEFIDETQQSIVVSPIKKKGQNQIHPQMPYVYPQKTNQIKNVRVETKLPQQLRHKQSEEDDDKSPTALIQTLFNTFTQDDHLSAEDTLNHLLLNDLPESKAQLSTTTEEKKITSECLETEAVEQLETQHALSMQAEEENHCEIVPIAQEALESFVTVQVEKNEESDVHENLEEMKCEDQETEVEHLIENDETNRTSPSKSDTDSIISVKVQETMAIEASLPSNNELVAVPENPLTELTFHDELLEQEFFQTKEAVSHNEQEDTSHEKDVENKKLSFFSLLKKAKVFK